MAAAHQSAARQWCPRALPPVDHGVARAAGQHVAQPRGLQRRHMLVPHAVHALPLVRQRVCRHRGSGFRVWFRKPNPTLGAQAASCSPRADCLPVCPVSAAHPREPSTLATEHALGSTLPAQRGRCSTVRGRQGSGQVPWPNGLQMTRHPGMTEDCQLVRHGGSPAHLALGRPAQTCRCTPPEHPVASRKLP